MTFVGVAAFPRLAHRLRRPTRLGPRGFVVYVACNTLALFLLRQILMPRWRRIAPATSSRPGGRWRSPAAP
jgi:hypothetical protein